MAQGWTRGMALTREVPRLATVGSFRRRRRGGEREDNPGRRGGGRQSVAGCACSTTGRGEGLPLELDLVRRSQEQGHAIGSVSPISFAFLGDVVWELYARTKHLLPPSRVASYRKETEREVMAEHQAACLDKLTGEGRLSEEEADIVRRGRNSNTPSVPKRLRSNPDSKTIYAKATALECLVGYLYLTDPARLAEIMDVLDMRTDEKIKVKG